MKYKTTYEYWHKGITASVVFRIMTTGKECVICEGFDLDIINFSCASPTEIIINYFCRDCNNLEKAYYPIISTKKTERFDSTKDKIDDMLEKSLTFSDL